MAEIQAGKGVIYGLGATAISGAITIAATNLNLSDVDAADEFKMDQLVNQTGDRVETMVASQRVRRLTVNFVPIGATRAAAIASIQLFLDASPLSVITFAGFVITALNTSYNYVGGASLKGSRESWFVANIGLMVPESSTPGTFTALPIVVG